MKYLTCASVFFFLLSNDFANSKEISREQCGIVLQSLLNYNEYQRIRIKGDVAIRKLIFGNTMLMLSAGATPEVEKLIDDFRNEILKQIEIADDAYIDDKGAETLVEVCTK